MKCPRNNCPAVVFQLVIVCLCFFLTSHGGYCFDFFKLYGSKTPIQQKHIDTGERKCNFLLTAKDSNLTTPEIITRYGLPVETHRVTTEDGYILGVYRIPRVNGTPVLLSHGLTASSRSFVINCDRRALAFRLYDEGFDVWLLNFRGTDYSRSHVKWTSSDPQFWNYSGDELGYYDSGAMVDYVLNETKKSKVSFVGHSMGSMCLFTLLASRPEYNDKIDWGFVLGGSSIVGNSENLRQLGSYEQLAVTFLQVFNDGPLFNLQRIPMVRDFLAGICNSEAASNEFGICQLIFFLGDGFNPHHIDSEIAKVFLGGHPNPVSMKLVHHALQTIKSRKATYYSYGTKRNMLKYGSPQPPLYDFSKVNDKRLVLFVGLNDRVIGPEDMIVSRTNHFPNSHLIRVNDETFNHGDFVLGKDADKLIYDKIISYLNGKEDEQAGRNA